MSNEIEGLSGITPFASAEWAHVHKPKQPYMDKGDPRYEITLVWGGDNKEMNDWADEIVKLCKKHKMKNCPIKDHKTKVGDEKDLDGKRCVTFKSSVKMRPGVIDMNKQPIIDDVGNGSIVRIKYKGSAFDAFGGGYAMYLNAVQVKDMVVYDNADFPDAE